MKLNPDNCDLFVSTNGNATIRIGNFQIENTEKEKLLGIHFDYHLSEILQKS